MLWGLSWTFASGSDIAWITDELDQPERIPAVLSRAARAQLTGAATGLLVLAALAWATRRDLAMIVAGSAMLLLAVFVAWRFSETRFSRVRTARWSRSWAIFKEGLDLVRRSRDLLLIFLATFLINGASDAAGRLAPKQLLGLGDLPFDVDPVVWLSALGILALIVGACTLRIVEHRLDGRHARHSYAVAALTGAFGTALLAFAPDPITAGAALVIVSGIAVPLTRIISSIWVNARTTTAVRATTHSFLAQAEYLGEITCGVAIAATATLISLPVALAGAAALFALTATLMRRRASAGS